MEEIKFEKVPVGIFDKVKTNEEEFMEKFIDELEELFPDTVKDGKVDFQALLERFGEYEDRDEKYELTWVGKNKARQESFEDIVGKTLKYIEEDSKNSETTENLYIEGDNLEVLKLLRKSYYGKIKMIYIDPPYNTGNDFVYKDDFTITKEEYDKLKGDVDEYGNRLVKNSADSGRYHSNWLNMMYPRLQVAKDLLTDDGVIFISIDDNEVHNLRKICDEIFGEDNLAGDNSVIIKTEGRRYGFFAKTNDNFLVYCKNYQIANLNKISIEGKKFEYKDQYGGFNLQDLRNQNARAFNSTNRPNLRYPFYVDESQSNGKELLNVYIEQNDKKTLTEVWPIVTNGYKSVWRWGKEKSEEELNKNLTARKGNDGIIRIFQKMRNIKELPKSILIGKKFLSNKGTREVTELLGEGVFDFPKPIGFVKTLVEIGLDEDSIILDFFSGSATTAHAVMDLNAEDGGNRKYIMVQLPELTEENSVARNEGYENICEIGKERIRRAGDKILEDNQDKEGIENLDTGFKVFKVKDTNFKRIVDTSIGADIAEMKYKNMKDSEDFNPHFTDLDVVYELMLRRQDIELTEEIKKLDNIGDRTYIVGDTMLVCLEEKITEEMVDKIGNIDTDLSWIVLRDSAFDDDCDLKVNTTRKLRTIIRKSRKKDQKIYWI